MKRLIVYDIPNETLTGGSEDILFSANQMVKPCVGCFGCWIKTPGKCVIADRCTDMTLNLAKCDEVVLISPVLFGSYSEKIKAVLDRSIGYILPYFRIVKGEMHHKMRYDKKMKMTALFYGKCDDEEKQIASSLVRANAKNFGAESYEVKFFDGIEELRGEIL